MAINDDRFDSDRLKGLDDLDDYTIADGEPDPRGWEVCAGTTKIGEVDDLIVDTSSMKVKYLNVDLEDDTLTEKMRNAGDEHVSIPVDRVQLDHQNKRVILSSGLRANDLLTNRDYAYRGSERHFERARTGAVPPDRAREYDLRGRGDEDQQRLTRAEEEVDVRKDRVQTGEVVVGKHVETDRFEQPVTRERDEVNIERRPVSERAPDSAIGATSGEVRVPITEERVTVEKHPVVKEELVVNKRTVEDRDAVETDVRKEQFDVQQRGKRSRE